MAGQFITFEGIDGSGKSTQIRLLDQHLRNRGYKTLVTRNPGGTKIGQDIRKILVDTSYSEIVPEAEIMLFLADRLQHIHEVIKPALLNDVVVLCDRYHDSSLAYQIGGRQLDFGWLGEITDKLILKPDHTIWLDLPVETAQKRLLSRAAAMGESNRLDQETLDFHQRVAVKYQSLAADHSGRYIRIDASSSEERMAEEIIQSLEPFFNRS